MYLYYLSDRILKLLTEGRKRTKYFSQIEEVKKNRQIVVDFTFVGIGDLLVWSQIPELLKKQYNVDFFISRKTRDFRTNFRLSKIIP
mgnify:CR=1 FL=1